MSCCFNGALTKALPGCVAQVTGDVIQSVREAGGETNVREFVGRVVTHSQPATPSSSTPYRQLKRLHSTQVGPRSVTHRPFTPPVYITPLTLLLLHLLLLLPLPLSPSAL